MYFSSPSIYEGFSDIVVVGDHNNHVNLISREGSVLGIAEFSSAIYATPFLFMNCGKLMMVISETCGKIHLLGLEINETFTFKIIASKELPGELYSSPIAFQDKIYACCRDNKIYCLAIL